MQAGKEPQLPVGLGWQDWTPGMLLSLLSVALEDSKLYHTPWGPGELTLPVQCLPNTNFGTTQTRYGGTSVTLAPGTWR